MNVLTHKYLGHESILEASAKPNASSPRKGVILVKDELKEGFCFRVGKGSTSFWFEDWSGFGALARRVPFVHITNTNVTLADLIVNGQWNVNCLFTSVSDFVMQKLLQIEPKLSPNIGDH